MNLKNIKTTGTFSEWVESIRIELGEQLTPKDPMGDVYLVLSEYCNFAPNSLPADPGRKIVISDLDGREISYLAFTEQEFESGKGLGCLVKARIVDTLASIKIHMLDCAAVMKRLSPPLLPKKEPVPKEVTSKNKTEKPVTPDGFGMTVETLGTKRKKKTDGNPK